MIPLVWKTPRYPVPDEERHTLEWGDRVIALVHWRMEGGTRITVLDGKTRLTAMGLDDAKAFASCLAAAQFVEASAWLLNHNDEIPTEG